MSKPTLITVDDDLDVLRAIERDLKNHYSEEYRVSVRSPALAALELLRRLKGTQRSARVAACRSTDASNGWC